LVFRFRDKLSEAKRLPRGTRALLAGSLLVPSELTAAARCMEFASMKARFRCDGDIFCANRGWLVTDHRTLPSRLHRRQLKILFYSYFLLVVNLVSKPVLRCAIVDSESFYGAPCSSKVAFLRIRGKSLFRTIYCTERMSALSRMSYDSRRNQIFSAIDGFPFLHNRIQL
jgi:hypothetical protein